MEIVGHSRNAECKGLIAMHVVFHFSQDTCHGPHRALGENICQISQGKERKKIRGGLYAQ